MEIKLKFKELFKLISVFAVTLLIVYFIHVRFFKVNVVFYSSLLDVFFSLIIVAILIIKNYLSSSLSRFEKFQSFFILGLLGYSFAISIPTVIDRSLSFYILEKLDQRGGGIKFDRFNEVFTKEYMFEHRLVDIRLTEQEESGTITIKDGCVELTSRGKLISTFSSFFRSNLLPKNRLIMGEYNDDLTHPFNNSLKRPNYECSANDFN